MRDRIGLEQGLKRLLLFRVIMVTTLLLVAVYVETVSETLLPVNPLYFLIVAIYALTILYAVAWRFLGRHEVQAFLQLVLDLVMVTGLVYVAGGTSSQAGFLLLYPIVVLSGSALLPRRHGLELAGLAVLFYAAMLLAVRTGLVPPRGLAVVPQLALKQVLYSIFVTTVACVTVALIGSYLARTLRTVGQQLEEATEKVADLTELYGVVVRSMHSGLLMADLAGRIRFVNEFGLGILRMGLPQVSGLTLTDVFGASLEPSSLQARVANPALSRFELTYRPPGGDEVELGFSASPLAASEGSSGGYLLVFQDLTQIRRLEREVRAKEKLAAAGEMAARLAHEIRNPLGSISGSAQVLMAEPNIASEQQRLLAIIRRESQRLSDTLNDFLMQSRPGPDRSGPVNVASVVNEAVTLLRNGPEAKAGHVIEVEADAGPHVCLADPDKVAQVIWNLARNGLEAMPAGGHLRVSVTRRGEEVVLAVRDQGVGIGRDEQRRIFEPFQTGARGTGLGLAIVYNLVRDCHGDITVRSLPSEGTEVRVRLPLLSSALPA